MTAFHARFYDGKTSTPQDVLADATQDGLRLSDNGGNAVANWTWSSVYIASKPKAGIRGTLGHIDNDACRLILQDEDWKEHIVPYAKTLRTGVQDGTWRFLGIIAALCLGIIAAGPDILDMIAQTMPDAWLQKIGKSTVDFMVDGHRVCRHNALADAALDRFVRQVDAEHKDMAIHIVSNSEINAMTTAGRNLVIFSGLLKAAPTPQALGGVLAHEVGHAHYRHPIRAVMQSEGMTFLLSAVFGAGAGTANATSILLSLKNSRAFEMQADAYSATEMLKNGYDPNGLVKFLSLAQKKGVVEDVAPEWAMSHPDTVKRIEALKAQIASEKKPSAYKSPFTPKEWRAIHTYCD